jgi:ankyrin repeat protein
VPQKIDKLYKAINKIKKAQREKATLVQAVLSGYYNLAHCAIKNGENVNQLVGKDDETPLLIAIRQENWVIAKLLIDNGAKRDVTTKSGLTISLLLTKMSVPQDIISALFDNIEAKNILQHGNYSPTLFSRQNVSGQPNKIASDTNPKMDMKSDEHAETSNVIAASSKTIGSNL